MPSKRQLGVRGEDLACAELERQGMRVLERSAAVPGRRCVAGVVEPPVQDGGPVVGGAEFLASRGAGSQ